MVTQEVEMNIKLDLLKGYVTDAIANRFAELNIEADEIADTKATEMLAEILSAVRDETLGDFDVVEKIVCVFEENHIACLGRHDF